MTAHSVYPCLQDKRVVVTGGGSSIGAAIVERFSQQGARVAFIDIAETDSRELERRLRTAVVISGGAEGVIVLGSTVRYEVDGEAAELRIVGSTEADPLAGRISQASPVGKALLGRRAGDQVVVRTPAAETRYRILEVR